MGTGGIGRVHGNVHTFGKIYWIYFSPTSLHTGNPTLNRLLHSRVHVQAIFLSRKTTSFITSWCYVKVYGNGSVAQAVLSKGDAGTFLSINLSWGMAVTMGVYWAGSISGTTITSHILNGFNRIILAYNCECNASLLAIYSSTNLCIKMRLFFRKRYAFFFWNPVNVCSFLHCINRFTFVDV